MSDFNVEGAALTVDLVAELRELKHADSIRSCCTPRRAPPSGCGTPGSSMPASFASLAQCPEARMELVNVSVIRRDEAVLPVGGRVGDVLDLPVRTDRKEGGESLVSVVGDDGIPESRDARLERSSRGMGNVARLREKRRVDGRRRRKSGRRRRKSGGRGRRGEGDRTFREGDRRRSIRRRWLASRAGAQSHRHEREA